METEAPPGRTTNDQARIPLMPLLGRLLYGLGRLCEYFKKYELARRFHGLAARHNGGGQPHYRLGLWYQRRSQWREAADHLHRAIQADPSHPHWHFKLGFILRQLGDHQAAAEATERGVITALKTPQYDRAYQVGQSLYEMGRWADAARVFKRAAQLRPGSAEAYWMIAAAADRLGADGEAAEACGRAVALRPENAAWHYAHGAFLERMDRDDAAAEAFRAAIALKNDVAEWHYRLGYVLEKLGQADAARAAYDRALECDASGEGRRFGVGVFHAAQGLWEQAAAAYAARAETNPENADLFFRLGMAHDHCYRRAAAADAYRRALALDSTQAEWHYRLGRALEHAARWDEAAAAYQAALARKEDHEGHWYHRLGRVLSRAGRADEALDAYRWTRVLEQADEMKTAGRGADAAATQAAEYTEYFEHLPLREKTVLYESHQGAVVGCNPYAIFIYLLEHPDFRDWTHVWVLNDKGRLPARLCARGNVITVRHDCDLYRRYLASASHLINNAAFPGYFMRRPGQRYLNTWHGTPLKTLGKDISRPFFEHENGTRNFLHATHLISPNSHTTRVLLQRYDLAGIYRGVLAETGYPRIDLTLNVTAQDREALRRSLGVEQGRRVILYAPTWRGALGQAVVDVERLAGDIRTLSAADGIVLFRGHHLVENRLADALPGVRVVPQTIDTNELLGIVDVLVTDYSSIAVDFLATGRPVVHYLYDYAAYRRERGLYFTRDELPGHVCDSIDEVRAVVERLLREGAAALPAAYTEARQALCPHDDGAATQRVVEMFFGGKPDHIVASPPQREAILFFAGQFVPNGITSAFLNLIHGLDRRRYLPVVITERDGIIASASHMERFAQLGADVAVLGRSGEMNLTPEERRVIDDFNATRQFRDEKMAEIYQAAYRREFYRLFGSARFSAVVNFEGYAPHWVSLFAFADRDAAARSVIYLHNDMQNEWHNRFAYLRAVMALYPRYDTLVSVGCGIHEENRQNLAGLLGMAGDRFAFCDNPIDVPALRKLAAESLDETTAAIMGTGGPCFLTMGRLSPEKDQAKLIRALARLRPAFPDMRLLILGQGPLEQELAALITGLGLDGVVHLLGQRANPYPALSAADCFVLSSNYEGQPMVLLEALALGKPVIATDIPGARTILADGYGLLVENSEDGLADGLRQFLAGEWTARPFDAEEYQAKAMQMFYRIVGSDTGE